MHASEGHRRHVFQWLLFIAPLLFSCTSVSLWTVTGKLTVAKHNLPNDQTGQILRESELYSWVDTPWSTWRYLLHISFEQHRSLWSWRNRSVGETEIQMRLDAREVAVVYDSVTDLLSLKTYYLQMQDVLLYMHWYYWLMNKAIVASGLAE